MLTQPSNSRFSKDQLQQSREQLLQPTLVGIRAFLIDFITNHLARLINTGELFRPAGKAQIREGGKSENIANVENKF